MNLKVIRITKVAFDVLFYLALLAIVLVVVLTVVSPVVVDAVREASEGASSATIMGVDLSVDLSSLDEAAVTQMAYAAGVAIVGTLAVGAFIAHMIRRALGAVLAGRAFKQENYERLRKISYAAFALVPFGWFTNSWMESIVTNQAAVRIDLPLVTIAGGLLALAVAELYKAGITLEDEAELTV